jgi:CheY-like chemotaxis protein
MRESVVARILVADDSANVRKFLCLMLSDAGHNVVEAKNGVEVIEIYQKSPPDVVITDLFMPDKEGIETIRELRLTHPKARIIAISGLIPTNKMDYLKYAADLGADYTFPKPIPEDALLEAVRKSVEANALPGAIALTSGS